MHQGDELSPLLPEHRFRYPDPEYRISYRVIAEISVVQREITLTFQIPLRQAHLSKPKK